MNRDQILELRRQGLTVRQIGKEVGLSKSRVQQILKNEAKSSPELETNGQLGEAETEPSTGQSVQTEAPPAEYAGPESFLPKVSPVTLDQKAKEAISEGATEEAHWRQEQIKRAKEIELLERESRALERQARASEMELKTLIAKAQLVGPDEESQQRIQAQIAELQHKAEAAEGRAHQKEIELGEEKHRWQLEQLTTRLDMVEKRGDNQWSFWTHLTNEILPIVGIEMRGLREAIAERAPRQLPNPGTPAVGATDLARSLELKLRFLNGGNLTESELAEVKALLRREAGLPAESVSWIVLVCPDGHQMRMTQSQIDSARTRGNVGAECPTCKKAVAFPSPTSPNLTVSQPAEVSKVAPSVVYE